jgi:Holliday junction resolvasome RuvABC endonuclease subunit
LLGVGERALATDAADALALALCVTQRARWSLPSLVRADK